MNSYVPGTHCPVKNLDIGQQYEFRVMAENQFGVSEPLMTTEPITAKHPFGMWKRNMFKFFLVIELRKIINISPISVCLSGSGSSSQYIF